MPARTPIAAVYDLVERHKRIVVGILGLIVAISILGLGRVKYNNNIELMLPKDPQVQNTVRFLREANSLDKLVIFLGLKDELHTTQDLILAVDQLAASINPALARKGGVKSPLVTQVISNVSVGNVGLEMISFLKYTPQLLRAEGLSKIDRLITPGGLKERLKFIYHQSLSPGSSFLMPFFRADPLGLSNEILRNIEKLSNSSGYDVVINSGHLVSTDARHALVVLKTPVVLTEGFGARKLIAYLNEELKRLPGFVSADIIAGHMHTVSNEDIIKRDIGLTSGIAALAFLLLFLFFFRDPRAAIIFFIPLAAVVIAINITYFVFKNLSYSVIGMGTVIAGISIDYGIYIYIAVRKSGKHIETIRQVIRPVVFSALTTISVFVVFFFSSVKGYNQLAFFSNVSIILCLVFALVFLPHFLRQENKPAEMPVVWKSVQPFNSKANDKGVVLCWLAIMAVAVIPARGLRFNNNISQFDGTAKEILLSEQRFQRVFAGANLPAIFVVSAPTLEEAYNKNTEIYETAVEKIGRDNFRSLASVWPGQKRRKANTLRWQEFWSDKKESELKRLLASYGKDYNFSPDAFADFFQQLHAPADLRIEPQGLTFFEHLREQFVLKKSDGYQIISFFPDQERYITQLSVLTRNFPGSFLVSRKNFSNDVARALGGELIGLSLLAVSLTVVLTVLLLKNIRLSILALTPVITSMIVIAAVIPLAGLSLNMSSIIAMMVVAGIVSDYGLFVVYYCKYKFNTGTYLAVTFAAVTTLIGAGVLLFAHHPILFSIGVTLVTGVLSGYLCSLIVIAPLYRMWIKGENATI